MKKTILTLALVTVLFGFSQTKTVHVKYINEPIKIDAVLDEAPWSQTKPATDFWQYFPTDSIQAKLQAEINFLFDDNNLYVGMKVYASGNNYITPSLRRDFSASGNDNITLLFDTFNDGTNAYILGTNPYGVNRDMLLSGGGSDIRLFDAAWDTKWVGESKIHDNYYITEWKIPLSAFKYREGETKWRMNSYHFDTQDNEQSTWNNIPQNQNIYSLAYMGDMIFERPLGKSKSPISIIPYISSSTSKDFETDKTETKFNAGGDVKLTIGNSMNLDLTFNPDFSQVEADTQVTNLTRFEISLPEQRQFFIENSDLFGEFGNNNDANPFFSRRIGIADDKDGNSIENKILAGVRLSGKISDNLRIGVLNVLTEEDKANEIAMTNNAVLSIQQKVFSRSNVSVFLIDKRATKDYDFLNKENEYNRVLGLDYTLASKDNTWIGKYFIHKSFSPTTSKKEFASGINTEYNSRLYNVRLSGAYVGENFRSDLGFIRRNDILKIDPKIQRNFWPKKGIATSHNISLIPIIIWRPELDLENSDYEIITRWESKFQNGQEVNASMYNNYTKLYEDFDPTASDDGIPLPEGENYNYTNWEVQYTSDKRKKIYYQIKPSFGQFYNGKKYSFDTELRYRIQPFASATIKVSYDNINLPEPYESAKFWLIGPKIDITFNKKLFWATFIQYSTQNDNFGVNSRVQWRFAPLSDLYLVYNDNYFANNVFAPKYRSLNLKLTYWLNI